jgi:hypothetical protein
LPGDGGPAESTGENKEGDDGMSPDHRHDSLSVP